MNAKALVHLLDTCPDAVIQCQVNLTLYALQSSSDLLYVLAWQSTIWYLYSAVEYSSFNHANLQKSPPITIDLIIIIKSMHNSHTWHTKPATYAQFLL